MRLLGGKAPLCAATGPGTVQLGRLGVLLAFTGPGPRAVSRSRKFRLSGCVGRPWAGYAGVHRSPPSTLEGPGRGRSCWGFWGRKGLSVWADACPGQGGTWPLASGPCWVAGDTGVGGEVEGAMGSPSVEGALGGWSHHRLGLASLPPLPQGVEE